MFMNDRILHSGSGIIKIPVQEAFKCASEWQAMDSTKM